MWSLACLRCELRQGHGRIIEQILFSGNLVTTYCLQVLLPLKILHWPLFRPKTKERDLLSGKICKSGKTNILFTCSQLFKAFNGFFCSLPMWCFSNLALQLEFNTAPPFTYPFVLKSVSHRLQRPKLCFSKDLFFVQKACIGSLLYAYCSHSEPSVLIVFMGLF